MWRTLLIWTNLLERQRLGLPEKRCCCCCCRSFICINCCCDVMACREGGCIMALLTPLQHVGQSLLSVGGDEGASGVNREPPTKAIRRRKEGFSAHVDATLPDFIKTQKSHLLSLLLGPHWEVEYYPTLYKFERSVMNCINSRQWEGDVQ